MSSDSYGVVMDDDAVAEYLESKGVGTLSFGNETGGYGIPMSFGYDRVEDRIIFQLSFGEESLKAKYIEEGNQVTLSAYDWESIHDWRSVVVRGTLHEIPVAENSRPAGIFAAFSKIASPEVFQEPLKDLDFEWYDLRIDDVHGRRAVDAENEE
ncbi:pyridoxamine 5'-phosphate oxidase family protein [Natrialbaceae archaeon A-CW2]